MKKLQPAGLFHGLMSRSLPKVAAVELRTQTLPNGEVEVTPLFTVEGLEIPSELVKPDKEQRILGWTIIFDERARKVHKETQARAIRLSKTKAADFLTQFRKSGVPIRSKDGRIEPRIETVKPEVSLELRHDDSLLVQSQLNTTSGVILGKPESITQLKQDDGWFAVGDDLLRVETTNTTLDHVLLRQGGNGVLTGDEVPRFLKNLQNEATHIGNVEKNSSLESLKVFSGQPENRLDVDGDGESVSMIPSLVYTSQHGKNYRQSLTDLEPFRTKGGGFARVSEGWIDISHDDIRRFGQACNELADKLERLEKIQGTEIPEALSQLRMAAQRDRSWNNPWSVYFSQAVQNAHRVIDTSANVEFRLNIVESNGRALLELDPIYNHERFRLTHWEVQDAVRDGAKWLRRRDTWIKVDKNKCKKINDGVESLSLQKGSSGFLFSANQREQVIDLFSVLGSIQHSAAYSEFLMKLADFTKIEDVPLPLSLRPEIQFRPYQKHGFNWLAFLHRFGLNGILADDMGLGKTLQTLAVIQRARELSGSSYPSLIICPTSVVNNWKAEVKKFFCDCRVCIYTGVDRDRKIKKFLNQGEVGRRDLASSIVITSYDIARLDHEWLNQVNWFYVVVDEGQNIKNPDAQRTRAIKTINAQHKLVLTGTPIQNNLEELWSLFDFAMPGFLGSRTDFRKQYSQNGRVNWDAVRSEETSLKGRVNPFILRRLKENVAKDLPPKIVIDQMVELTPRQVAMYKNVIEGPDYDFMIQEIDKKGLGRSRLVILATLTKLRAICNHPVLAKEVQGNSEVRYQDSGKLDSLKDLMEEIVEGGHRALLFSQSTQMLDIIQSFFMQWQIKNIRLDGSTPPNTRAILVDEFNRDTTIHCFLISTKAGGTGLNLTGADTVVFYDHDWNPANDLQAQDRAYRIGQSKPVTVYRIISKGTIEEKIIERQGIKKTLADEIIGSDDEGFKNLTKEELLSLFTFDEEIER